MNTKFFILIASAFLSFSASAADIEPLQVEADPRVEYAVNIANDVVSVKTVSVGEYSYKLVVMDSGLNGDIMLTSILLVGEGGVGSAAGYEKAFLLNQSTSSEISAKDNSVLITQRDGVANTTTRTRYRYDARAQKLIQVR